MVYGGFAWHGVFLVAAFGLHAHARWSAALTRTAAEPGLAPHRHRDRGRRRRITFPGAFFAHSPAEPPPLRQSRRA